MREDAYTSPEKALALSLARLSFLPSAISGPIRLCCPNDIASNAMVGVSHHTASSNEFSLNGYVGYNPPLDTL